MVCFFCVLAAAMGGGARADILLCGAADCRHARRLHSPSQPDVLQRHCYLRGKAHKHTITPAYKHTSKQVNRIQAHKQTSTPHTSTQAHTQAHKPKHTTRARLPLFSNITFLNHKKNIIPAYVALLSSQVDEVREQAVVGLGTLASRNAKCRDIVLASQGLMALLQQVRKKHTRTYTHNSSEVREKGVRHLSLTEKQKGLTLWTPLI